MASWRSARKHGGLGMSFCGVSSYFAAKAIMRGEVIIVAPAQRALGVHGLSISSPKCRGSGGASRREISSRMKLSPSLNRGRAIWRWLYCRRHRQLRYRRDTTLCQPTSAATRRRHERAFLCPALIGVGKNGQLRKTLRPREEVLIITERNSGDRQRASKPRASSAGRRLQHRNDNRASKAWRAIAHHRREHQAVKWHGENFAPPFALYRENNAGKLRNHQKK